MAAINITSIMSKVDSYTKSKVGQKRIKDVLDKYQRQGKRTTDGGSIIAIEENMISAAKDMIILLKQKAITAGVPGSVLEHFDSLVHSNPFPLNKDKTEYKIEISFTDNLTRPSLTIMYGNRKGQKTGEGIHNIVKMFNTGVKDTGKQVRGLWEEPSQSNSTWHFGDEYVLGKMERPELRFLESAIMEFNETLGKTYNATAYLEAEYIE